eukprot:TRINITY_DN2345_c0_g1_i1.p2 TRINITY_DN2345_c0_g1~~TRINITY_DN2345_c0_g1_i1.p2  ORF type:complete len:322 (-),score=89.60 TRINITY_DN2345_c0_g1_i1:1743-2708(-)
MVDQSVPVSDCSIIPSKYEGMFVVSTTDFFFPLIDDPYLQGMIGCANVLSDLYSIGVFEIDTMLMILAASEDMPAEVRGKVAQLMMKGFVDLAKQAGTSVSGGQSVRNPWPIIGGVAMSVRMEKDFIRPENAVVGDVILLTKPLGTQIAVNAHQWHNINPDLWEEISDAISVEDTESAYKHAAESMARLNKTGAILMHKYGAHAATDVTGFGILGHANNLSEEQHAPCTLRIHTLPVIKGMVAVAKKIKPIINFKLLEGYSAETSGGLLVCLPREAAENYIKEIEQLDGCPAWIVGDVIERKGEKNSAQLLPGKDLRVIEV